MAQLYYDADADLQLLDGKRIAEDLLDNLKAQVDARIAAGHTLTLANFFNISAMPNGKTDVNAAVIAHVGHHSGTILTLLCVFSILAGCAMVSQPGSLPSAEQQCANAGGMWSSSGGLCRYRGQ